MVFWSVFDNCSFGNRYWILMWFFLLSIILMCLFFDNRYVLYLVFVRFGLIKCFLIKIFFWRGVSLFIFNSLNFLKGFIVLFINFFLNNFWIFWVFFLFCIVENWYCLKLWVKWIWLFKIILELGLFFFIYGLIVLFIILFSDIELFFFFMFIKLSFKFLNFIFYFSSFFKFFILYILF